MERLDIHYSCWMNLRSTADMMGSGSGFGHRLTDDLGFLRCWRCSAFAWCVLLLFVIIAFVVELGEFRWILAVSECLGCFKSTNASSLNHTYSEVIWEGSSLDSWMGSWCPALGYFFLGYTSSRCLLGPSMPVERWSWATPASEVLNFSLFSYRYFGSGEYSWSSFSQLHYPWSWDRNYCSWLPSAASSSNGTIDLLEHQIYL